MRRRNREINIFSVSALDLFASSMGVFVLIALMLFPYYLRKQNTVDVEQLQQAFDRLQQDYRQLQSSVQTQQVENQQLRSQMQAQNDEIQQLRKRLSRSFLVVALSWETQKQDVDLHVIDPDGHRYFFGYHNQNGRHYPDSDAFISVDSISGPGVEVWLDPEAAPGIYQIYASLFSRHGNPQQPVAAGKVYFRDGNFVLPSVQLPQEQTLVKMADLEVGPGGQVRLLSP